MIQQNQKDEIINLIKSNFDPELIALEFDLPLEQIIELKKYITMANTQSKKKNMGPNQKSSSFKKMQQIRENYFSLFLGNDLLESYHIEPLSTEQLELVNSTISFVEDKLLEMDPMSVNNKRNAISSIISKVKKVSKLPLDLEQSEKLFNLLNSETIKFFCNNTSESVSTIKHNIDKLKLKIMQAFVRNLEYKACITDEIDSLKQLNSRITSQMSRDYPIAINSARIKINTKISKLQQIAVIDKLQNDVPESIMQIASDLANDSLDVAIAENIINFEAQNVMKNTNKSFVPSNIKTCRNHLMLKIRTLLTSKSQKYYIQNPENAVLNLGKLSYDNFDLSLDTIVKNLIERNEFDRARSICDTFSNGYSNIFSYKYINKLLNEIRCAEIGNMVLKGLNNIEEDDTKYFELIEKGLKEGNISTRSIPLGTSKDGLRKISLADILETEKGLKR